MSIRSKKNTARNRNEARRWSDVRRRSCLAYPFFGERQVGPLSRLEAITRTTGCPLENRARRSLSFGREPMIHEHIHLDDARGPTCQCLEVEVETSPRIQISLIDSADVEAPGALLLRRRGFEPVDRPNPSTGEAPPAGIRCRNRRPRRSWDETTAREDRHYLLNKRTHPGSSRWTPLQSNTTNMVW